MRLALLVAGLIALGSGCKKDCELGEYEAMWSDVADQFMDEDRMGGEPMGCNARVDMGRNQLWSLYSGATEAQVAEAARAVFREKGYTELPALDEGVYRFEKGEQKVMIATGRVGDAAELLIYRR